MFNDESGRNDFNDSGDVNFTPPIDFNLMNEGEKTAKKIISRSFFAAFVYLIVCQLGITLIQYVIIAIVGTDRAAALFSDYVFSLTLSSIIQYFVGFPLFFLTIRTVKKADGFEKSNMKPSHIFYAFLVCQTVVFFGNLIGNWLNSVIGSYAGAMPENSIDTIINEVPLYVLIPTVVILAPIFEELMFRKLLIDRLSYVGDVGAVIMSAVAFGLFHMNLYQFFYATFAGLVFGYVYAKTRKITYTIILHMLVNFFGSVIPLGLVDCAEKVEELLSFLESGASFAPEEYLLPVIVYALYVMFVYSMSIAGAVILALYIAKGGLKGFGKKKEIYLPSGKLALISVCNVSAILFCVSALALTFINLIASFIPVA